MYDAPRTPYRRLLEQGVLSPDQQLRLEQVYQNTNPVKLLKDINKELERLWLLAHAQP